MLADELAKATNHPASSDSHDSSPETPDISYTQWEAWLALYHRIPCYVYYVAPSAERPAGYVYDQGQARRQLRHWDRLRACGQDRTEIADLIELRVALLRILPGLVRPKHQILHRILKSLVAVLLLALVYPAWSTMQGVLYPEILPPALPQLRPPDEIPTIELLGHTFRYWPQPVASLERSSDYLEDPARVVIAYYIAEREVTNAEFGRCLTDPILRAEYQQRLGAAPAQDLSPKMGRDYCAWLSRQMASPAGIDLPTDVLWQSILKDLTPEVSNAIEDGKPIPQVINCFPEGDVRATQVSQTRRCLLYDILGSAAELIRQETETNAGHPQYWAVGGSSKTSLDQILATTKTVAEQSVFKDQRFSEAGFRPVIEGMEHYVAMDVRNISPAPLSVFLHRDGESGWYSVNELMPGETHRWSFCRSGWYYTAAVSSRGRLLHGTWTYVHPLGRASLNVDDGNICDVSFLTTVVP